MSSFPQHFVSEFVERGDTTLNRHEVVACELSNLAVERACTVRHQDLRLTESLGIHKNLARAWMACMVFELKNRLVRGERYPQRFSTPAAVENERGQGQQRSERSACLGRQLILQPTNEMKISDLNLDLLRCKRSRANRRVLYHHLFHDLSSVFGDNCCFVQESSALRLSKAVIGEPHHRITIYHTHQVVGHLQTRMEFR